jgi:hypothetical protein
LSFGERRCFLAGLAQSATAHFVIRTSRIGKHGVTCGLGFLCGAVISGMIAKTREQQ